LDWRSQLKALQNAVAQLAAKSAGSLP